MNFFKTYFIIFIIVLFATTLIFTISCSHENAQESHTVGGTITGITGNSTTISINDTDPQELNTDGPFTFAKNFYSTESYNVTVTTQPSSPLICLVNNSSGTVTDTDINNISIDCTNQYGWSLSGNNSVTEGNEASYTISLSGVTLASGETASIHLLTQDGTSPSAIEGSDYISIDGYMVTITGPASSTVIYVQTITDSQPEDSEYYQVQIFNPSQGLVQSGQNMVQTAIID